MSAEGYGEKFECYTKKSIARWLRELEEDGLIISGSYNKMKADRTKWYTTSPGLVYAVAIGEIEKLNELKEWCRQHRRHIKMNEMQIKTIHHGNRKNRSFLDPALLKMDPALLKIEQAIPPRNPPWDTTRKLIFSLPEENGNQKIDQQGTPLETPPQKVAPKSSPEPHEWMRVADEMSAYFKGQGKHEWKRLCAAVEIPSRSVSVDAVCSQWAAKHQNTPELLNWQANTGGLTGWIRIAAKTQKNRKRNPAKIESQGYEKYRN
ncbi:MAG: hypothetical protein KI786_10720 [Mameliella sp.]|nr:hypothetical protein [Phaeodactylibacter sp.]